MARRLLPVEQKVCLSVASPRSMLLEFLQDDYALKLRQSGTVTEMFADPEGKMTVGVFPIRNEAVRVLNGVWVQRTSKRSAPGCTTSGRGSNQQRESDLGQAPGYEVRL